MIRNSTEECRLKIGCKKKVGGGGEEKKNFNKEKIFVRNDSMGFSQL